MVDYNVIDGAVTALIGIYCVFCRHELAEVIGVYKSRLVGIQTVTQSNYSKYVFFTLGIFFILYGTAAVLHITQFR